MSTFKLAPYWRSLVNLLVAVLAGFLLRIPHGLAIVLILLYHAVLMRVVVIILLLLLWQGHVFSILQCPIVVLFLRVFDAVEDHLVCRRSCRCCQSSQRKQERKVC